MQKHLLNEAEICQNFITPALVAAGWDPLTQVRREYTFTAGQIQVRGKLAVRGIQKRADYLLFYQAGLPLAVIEAKDNSHGLGSGMPQALSYAEALDVPFVFSSNGDGFLFHDRTGLSQSTGQPTEQTLTLSAFPSPAELWERYRQWKKLTPDGERLARQPYHSDEGREPRYYQRIAIQRTVEAVATGQKRLLLIMATGTGKTLTVFQIIWRLWKARKVKRVLFLVDRNILADQTMRQDFKPFGSVMTKVQNRNMDPSYEIYLALYQAVTGTEDISNIYKQFTPGFFDLVVIDECHRGSAREDSTWREILTYFNSAIHLGLTATPKETEEVSTLPSFGEPLYESSLKQGIADGFLAPYKVVRIDLDKDLEGWRPTDGMVDDHGQYIEDRIYNQKDMDKTLILTQRTRLVAHKIFEYMKSTDPYGKTIVFCENIHHAERMRSELVNQLPDFLPSELGHGHRFVAQITGDNDEGKRQLDHFIDKEARYPVIATTSKLLTTGVDAKTCKLIVLDQRIQSMIEFKQIIGRGTRIDEDYGKLWFTVVDFKKATELFADPSFDGQPVVIYEPGPEDPVDPPGGEDGMPEEPQGNDGAEGGGEVEGNEGAEGGGDAEGHEPLQSGPTDGTGRGDPPPPIRYTVSPVAVKVVAERVLYYGPNGKLITESLTDYTRAQVRERFATLSDFLSHWNSATRKAAVLEELQNHGVLLTALQEQVDKALDPFDLLCHVVFDQPPLSRRERAESVKKRDVFTKYGKQARAVLNALLDKYADEGLAPVEDLGVLRVQPLTALGTPVELIKAFGGKDAYLQAVQDLEEALYAA